MRIRIGFGIACTVVVTIILNAFRNETRAQPDLLGASENASSANEQTPVEHGMYIVHHVAMCTYCHTPKNEEGVLDIRQLLHGAPIPVESPFPRMKWAFQAPRIAGLPGGYTEDDMANFLQTGVSPTGRHPQPPMPQFRMTPEDAQAVAAYLQSLK
jgi:cytochrome c553